MIHHHEFTSSVRAKPLVLIVDDVLENRSGAQRRLERMGYDCILADGGVAALELLETITPDVVLLDFMMPGMSGLGVLRQLRAMEIHSSMSVIMLTARTDSDAIVASLKEGANDYVHKPIDFPALKARIDLHIERQRTTHALVSANTRMDGWAATRAVELSEVRGLLHEEIQRSQALETQRRLDNMGGSADLTFIARSLNRIMVLAQQWQVAGAMQADQHASEIFQCGTDALNKLSNIRLAILE